MSVERYDIVVSRLPPERVQQYQWQATCGESHALGITVSDAVQRLMTHMAAKRSIGEQRAD